MFYAKIFKDFLLVFLYLIMCIVFKIHVHPFFIAPAFCGSVITFQMKLDYL